MTHFWNFGTHLISRGRMNQETSNLAQIWRALSTREKIKIRSKGVMRGSRDPLLEFWDPSNIAGTNESGNIKFGTDMEGSE